MTVVSSREFASNQEKYFDLAVSENVCIKRGSNIFQLLYASTDKNAQKYLAPDDDFRRAISMEEFKKKALTMVEKVHKMCAN